MAGQLIVHCEDHMAEAKVFAEKMGLSEQLQGQLDYLRDYCDGTAQCELFHDFAPHSFAFNMSRKKPGDTEWTHWFNGGLIYQGPDSPANGGAPSFCVSLARGTGWFVHT